MNPWRPRLVVVAVLLGNVVTSARGADSVTTKDLIGVWTCTAAVIDGRPVAAETVQQLRLTLTADRYKSERGDQVLFDSTYAVDFSKHPARIDMIGTEGELQGKAAPGILKLDGNLLTLCYVMPGRERPTAFASQPQSGTFLVTYQRTQSK